MCNNDLCTIEKKTTENVIVNDDDRKIEMPGYKFQKHILCSILYHSKSHRSTSEYRYSKHEFERFDNKLKYGARDRSS